MKRLYALPLLATGLIALVGLSACGEGWEMSRVTNMVPYGGTRTAGSGVMYVRAQLLPVRSLNVLPAPVAAPAKPPAAPPVIKPETVRSAEPVFKKDQRK